MNDVSLQHHHHHGTHHFWNWKTIQNLCSSHCLLSKSYFLNFESSCSIFAPSLKQNLMQKCCFSSLTFLGTPNCNEPTHKCTWTRHYSAVTHTHYSLIPSRKWLTKFYLHAAAEAMPAAVVSSCSLSRNYFFTLFIQLQCLKKQGYKWTPQSQ